MPSLLLIDSLRVENHDKKENNNDDDDYDDYSSNTRDFLLEMKSKFIL